MYDKILILKLGLVILVMQVTQQKYFVLNFGVGALFPSWLDNNYGEVCKTNQSVIILSKNAAFNLLIGVQFNIFSDIYEGSITLNWVGFKNLCWVWDLVRDH